jgi:CAAX amino terminal protease family.
MKRDYEMMLKVNNQNRSKQAQWKAYLPIIILGPVVIGFIIVNRVYCLFYKADNLPADLAAAFFLGNLFFGLSLLISNWNHFEDILPFFIYYRKIPPFLLKDIRRVLPSTVYIIIEELFWRGYLQAFFFNNILLVPLVTGLFTLAHFFKFKKEKADILSALEFYLYFLMLSYVFYATKCIYAAILIHFIRNTYAMYWKALKRQMNVNRKE